MSRNPGTLRDVLVLQVQNEDPDRTAGGRPQGGVDAQWTDVVTIRGDVQESGAAETERGGRNVSDETVTVLTHSHPQLTTRSRLVWLNGGDEVFRVQSVSRSGQMDRYVSVRCTLAG